MKKNRKIIQPDIEIVRHLSKTLKCDPVTATILVNRKIISPEKAFVFLNPSLNSIRSPFSIKDMDVAVNRIDTAITNHEKILIFGDYDVDGITATTILYDFFKYLGTDVSYYIPHRSKEGYGLQTSHIPNHALPEGINLIITVDCGSDSHDAVKAAHKAGIDVIITDHHKISEPLPPAVAVVNPKRRDCTSGFDNLAGVGLAFYLLICLRKHLRDKNFWRDRQEPNLKNICDLVALGTVADIVPLVDDNRILTKTGLEVINSNTRPGIKAILEVCGIKKQLSTHSIGTEDIAFKLAPRLNAAGRIDHAKIAVELLTEKNFNTAKEIAVTLNKLNTFRQTCEKEILEEILLHLNENPHLLENKALVLSGQGWNEGVLGIVASRLANRYFRPVVLISIRDGAGKGSARSIPGFDLYEGFCACFDDLEKFGGHPMAAGLKIKAANIERFQRNFETIVEKMTAPDDFVPELLIDYELDFDHISDKLIDELESLQPFGPDNQEPLFAAGNIKVASSTLVGGNHRRMLLTQPHGKTQKSINAIHFNIETGKPLEENFDQIIFRLRWNRWNGSKTAQIIIEDT